ncbi:MAG: hypothetical protein FK734_12545 [Asgard group archaeon]|nr:hypothetical protein [Asgard group archaeon]
MGFLDTRYTKVVIILIILLMVSYFSSEELVRALTFTNYGDNVKPNNTEYKTGLKWQEGFIDLQETNYAYHQEVKAQTDAEGNIHLAYSLYFLGTDEELYGYYELHYQKFNVETESWEPRIKISEPAGNDINIFNINVELDDENRAHLAWVETDFSDTIPDAIYYCYFDGTDWSEKIFVENATQNFIEKLELTSVGNKVQFFWTVYNDTNRIYDINMKNFSLETETFSETKKIANALVEDNDFVAVADATNHIMIAWKGFFEELHAYKIYCIYEEKDNLQYSIPFLLGNFNNENESGVAITFDRQNSLHVVWVDQKSWYNSTLHYKKIVDGYTIISMEISAEHIQNQIIVTVDQNNTAHLLWTVYYGVRLTNSYLVVMMYKQITANGEVSKTDNLLGNRLVYYKPSMVVTTVCVHIFFNCGTSSTYRGINYLRGFNQSAIDRYGPIIIGLIVGLPIIGVATFGIVRKIKTKQLRKEVLSE